MTGQPKRKRGPGRPVLENLKNAGPRLREGESSQTHRVRAGAAVQAWFGAMSAEQRGEVLARVMHQEAERLAANHGEVTVTQHQEAGKSRALIPGSTLPKEPHHIATVEDLKAGGTLTGGNGRVWMLRRADGSGKIEGSKKVEHMLRAGMLTDANREDAQGVTQGAELR